MPSSPFLPGNMEGEGNGEGEGEEVEVRGGEEWYREGKGGEVVVVIMQGMLCVGNGNLVK